MKDGEKKGEAIQQAVERAKESISGFGGDGLD